MGILPILLVIIVIASVITNYNRLARQRLIDEQKRMDMRRMAKQAFEDKQNADVQTNASSSDRIMVQPIQRKAAPVNQKARPRVCAKDIRSGVIMAEILNKPVSLREK